ncbi:MAG: hypothetical protein LC667_20970 [Thioalkalivibrio sp.]|nr:hypothetical protein [Thioalkalivibrio sp.]
MITRPLDNDLRLTRRLGVLVLAVMQLVGATVLPGADGKLDVERYGTPVHVESEGNHDCTPHHDHLFCQVVRSTAMANPAQSAAEVPALVAPVSVHALHGAEVLRVRTEALVGCASPRAPPSV